MKTNNNYKSYELVFKDKNKHITIFDKTGLFIGNASNLKEAKHYIDQYEKGLNNLRNNTKVLK